MKIIVIDDEFASLNTFLYNVIDKFEVDFKMFMRSPDQALQYAETNDVCGAFIDINMPGINGIELAEKLMTIKPDIKIVFISGYTYNKEEIKNLLGENLIGFCDKPYETKTLCDFVSDIISNGKNKDVFIRTFGSFDLFVGKKPLFFASAKSKELLALLIDRNGSFVTMGEAICELWGDGDLQKSKILYRDAVWKLRKVLKENNLDLLVQYKRAALSVNKIYECDYWRLIDKGVFGDFNGSYMTGYGWSLTTEAHLCLLFEHR